MNKEKILELAAENETDTYSERVWAFDEGALIAFAHSLIDAERDNIEAPIVRVPIEIFARLRKQKVCVSDLVDAIRQVEAERDTRKLTDAEILDAVNSADFGSMVTADDYIYVLSRAIERRINGEEQ